VYNEFRKGDSIYIEYSPSNPKKNNAIGLAHRDGISYLMAD
jgi:hypothetical protein